MIRDVLRMGDPRLLQRSRPVDALRHARARARCSPTCATRWPRRTAPVSPRRRSASRCRSSSSASSTTPRYPDAEPVPYTELVNPVLTPLSDEMEEGWEGCLSVPGLARRRAALYARCATRASTRTGGRSSARSTGFHARVVQHECDHLDGILYPMRMRDLRQFGFTDILFPDAELIEE